MRLIATIASFALLLSPALAHEGHEHAAPPSGASAPSGAQPGQPAAHDEPHGHEEGPDTEHMFGFTTGTDVLEQGHYEIETSIESSFGKRIGHYNIGAWRNSFKFAPFDGVSVELGATGNRFSIHNVPGFENRRTSGLGELSAEFRWQLLKRGPSPFGLTLLAEPRLGFLDETSGERGRGQGLETRLLLDTALIPNTLYAGLNGIYEMDKFRPRGITLFSSEGEPLEGPSLPCGPTSDVNLEVNPEDHTHTTVEDGRLVDSRHVHTDEGDHGHGAGEAHSHDDCAAIGRRKSAERSSKLGVSGALAFQAIPNVFLGAEVRYLRAYDGLTLQHFRGEAVFVGPTLYAKLTDHLAISGAFSTQVAGHAVGVPGRLDLTNFSRHEARLVLLYEF